MFFKKKTFKLWLISYLLLVTLIFKIHMFYNEINRQFINRLKSQI